MNKLLIFSKNLRFSAHSVFIRSCTNITSPITEVSNKNETKPMGLSDRGSNSRSFDGTVTFSHFIKNRRDQAIRSVVVQVSSENSFPELYGYCSTFGEILTAYHYKVPNDNLHYILIEFKDKASTDDLLNNSLVNQELSGVPARSQFLWFKANGKKKLVQNKVGELRRIDALHTISFNELQEKLQECDSVNNQTHLLYESTKLNNVGERLRFLAARQIESAIAGIFPFANAQPFGSSVNGFGRMGCDLDLILRFNQEDGQDIKDSRLVFHTKENLTNERSQMQRQMELVGDMLNLFLPGVFNVRQILQARVPIIKYHHVHLNLEVDLSMSNLSGMYMSEILYIFGMIDERVKPLVFSIRHWAQYSGLTSIAPGRWISNFSLTCMVLFFLQQLKNPVLPTINYLMKSANSNDVRITEDGINCTFKRDYQTLKFKTLNNSAVSELLLQFFEFYSQFDFGSKAVNLNEGKVVQKADNSPMYIINPLEQIRNVTQNVSMEECERFRIEVRNAAWILESEVDAVQSTGDRERNKWGLLNLFKNSVKSTVRSKSFFKSRLVDINDLFENQNNSIVNGNIKNVSKSIKNKISRERRSFTGTAIEESAEPILVTKKHRSEWQT